MMPHNISPHMNATHIHLLPQIYCRRSYLASAFESSLPGASQTAPVPSSHFFTRGTLYNPTVLSHAISHAMVGAILGVLNSNSSVAGLSYGSVVIVKVITGTIASRQEILVNVSYLDLN